MRKTGGEIEQDLFDIIRNSELADLVTGDVYLNDTRPENATGEDIVVSFLAGMDGQFQTGVVNVNIYVPSIDNGGLVKDVTRCQVLERKANEIIHALKPTDYRFSLDGIIQTFRLENLDTYFVNARIHFELKTF